MERLLLEAYAASPNPYELVAANEFRMPPIAFGRVECRYSKIKDGIKIFAYQKSSRIENAIVPRECHYSV